MDNVEKLEVIIIILVVVFGGFVVVQGTYLRPKVFQNQIALIDTRIHTDMINTTISQPEKYTIIKINCRVDAVFTEYGVSECTSYFTNRYLNRNNVNYPTLSGWGFPRVSSGTVVGTRRPVCRRLSTNC